MAEALVDYCRTLPIEQILALPDVRERIARYWKQDALFQGMIAENTTVHGSVVVLDLRDRRGQPDAQVRRRRASRRRNLLGAARAG